MLIWGSTTSYKLDEPGVTGSSKKDTTTEKSGERTETQRYPKATDMKANPSQLNMMW